MINNAYADDTVLYLQDVKSLKKAIHILRYFQLYSGLAINLKKSELLAQTLLTLINLTFRVGQVKLLGLTFNADLHDIMELN